MIRDGFRRLLPGTYVQMNGVRKLCADVSHISHRCECFVGMFARGAMRVVLERSANINGLWG